MTKTSPRTFLVSNELGMTLIEIMIVIMIIAGLMTVLGNSAINQYSKAKVQQAVIQMGNIQSALKNYALDCGDFPSNELGLEALVTDPGDGSCKNWGPNPYLRAAQLKDPFNHRFIYSFDGGEEPVLTFLGRDGKPGGKNFDRDISTADATAKVPEN